MAESLRGVMMRRSFEDVTKQVPVTVSVWRQILSEPSVIELMADKGDKMAKDAIWFADHPNVNRAPDLKGVSKLVREARLTEALSQLHPASEQLAFLDEKKQLMVRFWTAPLGNLLSNHTQN